MECLRGFLSKRWNLNYESAHIGFMYKNVYLDNTWIAKTIDTKQPPGPCGCLENED